MSAWLVSEIHVAAIVSAAQDAGLFALGLPADPDGMGRGLFAENMRSLRARYEDRAASYWPEGSELAAAYTHHPVHVAPMVLVKACDCYDYQACETDDYETRPASRLVDAVRRAALAELGMSLERAQASSLYDAAPWGLEPEHVAA